MTTRHERGWIMRGARRIGGPQPPNGHFTRKGVGVRSSVDNQIRVDWVGPARMDMSVRQNGVDIT
jgi:hypothetical protein